MTDKYGRGPKSRVHARMSAGGFVVPGASDQEVVPYRLNSFDMTDWHVENGWPVPGAGPTLSVDAYNITPDPVTYPTPDSITTNADARWIGADFAGTSWPAHQGSGTWSGSGTAKANYTYKLDGTSYNVPGVKLDSDNNDFLTADLRAIAGNRYAFILVFKPYTVGTFAADDESLTDYGLIAPAAAATGQPELRVRNSGLVVKQSSELDPKIPYTTDKRPFAHYLRRGAPSYLMWAAGANHFHIYVGDGPSTMKKYSSGDPHDLPKVFNFNLGAYANGTHTADMMLFDVSFYNDILTGTQTASEVATLATAYGGK